MDNPLCIEYNVEGFKKKKKIGNHSLSYDQYLHGFIVLVPLLTAGYIVMIHIVYILVNYVIMHFLDVLDYIASVCLHS